MNMTTDDPASRRAALAERRARLSQDKRALFEQRLQGETTGGMQAVNSLVILQAGDPTKRPLFFVHPAVGDVLCYADLARRLGSEQPFYGLEARGLHGGQEPLASVEELASYYVQLVKSAQPQGPYSLGGWSLGGLVAFEMAQQFHTQAQQVRLLALVDPSEIGVRPDVEPDELRLLAGLARGMGLPLEDIVSQADEARELSLDERLAKLLELARRANALPPEMGLQEARQAFQVFKSNIRALRHYVPRPYAGPLALFKASEQEDVAQEDLGWGAWAQEVQVRVVPGGHYTIVREPNVGILAEQLKPYLQ